MKDMEEKSSFFRELTLNLQHEGVAVGSEAEDGFLTVELDGRHLCLVTERGGVRYQEADAADTYRKLALERVIDINRTTAEYMRQMSVAPFLSVGSLSGDYRLLAEFNGIVLAGHPTGFGTQFVTWEWIQNHTALWQGFYYEGSSGYAAAKQDFAGRSGLVPRSALFTPEQLAEVYRSIHETLDSGYPITDERQQCLESAVRQIETAVPDLKERVELSNIKELEFAETLLAQDSGMQFC